LCSCDAVNLSRSPQTWCTATDLWKTMHDAHANFIWVTTYRTVIVNCKMNILARRCWFRCNSTMRYDFLRYSSRKFREWMYVLKQHACATRCQLKLICFIAAHCEKKTIYAHCKKRSMHGKHL
jgi:hypothetical protein